MQLFVRCKLFYKKDGNYKDRGVGMLHLKKTGDIGQMLLRADTNLGKTYTLYDPRLAVMSLHI